MNLLPFIPLLPLLGFLILFITEGKLNKYVVALIGAGFVGIAGILALLVGIDFYAQGATPYSHELWTWMSVGEFQPSVTLYLDPLAMVMTGVITGVGFLIHTYATGYMW